MVALLFLAAALVLALAWGLNLSQRLQLWQIPGPGCLGGYQWPTAGWLWAEDNLSRKLKEALKAWPRAYGPVMKLFIGRQPYIILSGLDAAMELEQRHADKLCERMDGDHSLTRHQDALSKCSKMQAYWPPFHSSMKKTIRSFSQTYAEDLPVNVSREVGILSLQVLLGGMLGVKVDVGAPSHHDLLVRPAQALASEHTCTLPSSAEAPTTFSLLWESFGLRPRFASREVSTSWGLLHGLVKGLMAKCKAEAQAATRNQPDADFFGHGDSLQGQDHDLLTHQMTARTSTKWNRSAMAGEKASKVHVSTFEPAGGSYIQLLSKAMVDGSGAVHLSDEQVTGHLLSSMLRGSKAVYTAIVPAIEHLAGNMVLQESAIGEADAFMGSLSDASWTSFPSIAATVCESLRFNRHSNPLAHPVYIVKHNMVLGSREYSVPPGCKVVFNSLGTHFDHRNFPNPEEFQPARFLRSDDSGRKAVHIPVTWRPMGLGTDCQIAQELVLSMATLAVVKLLKQFTFAVPNKDRVLFAGQVLQSRLEMQYGGRNSALGTWVDVKARRSLQLQRSLS